MVLVSAASLGSSTVLSLTEASKLPNLTELAPTIWLIILVLTLL